MLRSLARRVLAEPLGSISTAEWRGWQPADVRAWATTAVPQISTPQLAIFEAQCVSGPALAVMQALTDSLLFLSSFQRACWLPYCIMQAHHLERWGMAGGPATLLEAEARRLTGPEVVRDERVFQACALRGVAAVSF